MEGFQHKVYGLHRLDSWFILMKFFGIKKYILSQFLHYPFYDFGGVYYEGTEPTVNAYQSSLFFNI